MIEDDLARRIVDRLDQHLGKLPASVVTRLADTRERALRRKPIPVSAHIRFSHWLESHRMMFTVALPALFVVMAAGVVFFLQSASTQDPFDVETLMLADELPIHAYTDPGFNAWLQHTSYERQP